ncbi:NmrA family NAD(P)-binding protein [Roseococcus microcysteis]|uniref:NmrA family NAD(P)-binding protein n=1 Tax=Roseococcus microcysteis TaxID=2771361 RepID=UPI00168AA67C|nr:NAD(P)H-binding protein [Roseococcus microcysteis]
MFLIAGLTGNTGAAAARTLLDAGHQVRGLVRDPSRAAGWAARGVELATADLRDTAALTEAMRGVAGAYLLIAAPIQAEDVIGDYITIATSIRAAARAAGLRRLVFLSSEGAHLASGTGAVRALHVAEALLADAAPSVTFLRPSYFQENWRGVFDAARHEGVLPSFHPAEAPPRGMVATRDIGAEAARLLTEATTPPVVEFTSAIQATDADAAAAAAQVLGRPVQVVRPPREAWEGILRGAGLGADYTRLLIGLYDGINSGHLGFSGAAPLRTGPTTLSQTMRDWV